MFNIVFLISSVFQTYIFYLILNCFFDKKRVNKYWEWAAFGLFYIVTSVVFLAINIPIITALGTVVSLFLVTFLYKSTIWNRLLAVVCSFVIMAISE